MAVHILKTGMHCSVQDLGRMGYQRYGVPVSGSMDKHATAVANLLVGNAKELAVLEFVMHGAVVRFEEDVLIAFSGSGAIPFYSYGDGTRTDAVTPDRRNTKPLPIHKAIFCPANSLIEMHYQDKGCRIYMAVAGGFDVPVVMGSRSSYLPAAAGEKLEAGCRLAIGKRGDVSAIMMRDLKGNGNQVEVAKWGAIELIEEVESDYVRVIRGLEWDWFDKVSQNNWLNDWFTVSLASDRMAIKLEGAQLKRSDSVPGDHRDMISTAVTMGTVQILPDGSLLILMADAQTTGGYPRIAQVIDEDLHMLAQKRPGDKIRFRVVSPLVAEELYLNRQAELLRLQRNIKTKFSV